MLGASLKIASFYLGTVCDTHVSFTLGKLIPSLEFASLPLHYLWPCVTQTPPKRLCDTPINSAFTFSHIRCQIQNDSYLILFCSIDKDLPNNRCVDIDNIYELNEKKYRTKFDYTVLPFNAY